ncbi:MAG: pyrroline-5-carboxylate reductase dimerization domain-containing protein, partial [Lachnospiraceae bacterium]
GMPREMAYEFVSQSLIGSAKMVLETKEHPGKLKDMVCSPGGTTIAGVAALEEFGFRNAIIKATDQCYEKSEHMK